MPTVLIVGVALYDISQLDVKCFTRIIVMITKQIIIINKILWSIIGMQLHAYCKPLLMVAQLAKATGRHQTEDAAFPGSNPSPPQSPERGQDI
jgi:hypothetical protein